MRSLGKKRFLVGLFTLVAGLLLTGCASGYQQVDGRWVFVTWNETSGRVDIPVPDVDGASFNPFDKSEYARDAARVYYRAVPVEGADATTFRHMRGAIGRIEIAFTSSQSPSPARTRRRFASCSMGLGRAMLATSTLAPTPSVPRIWPLSSCSTRIGPKMQSTTTRPNTTGTSRLRNWTTHRSRYSKEVGQKTAIAFTSTSESSRGPIQLPSPRSAISARRTTPTTI
jgi:hypothetical protein